MRFFLRVAAWLLLLAAGGAASAHEFWMLPDRFDVAAGSSVHLSLLVGQNFSGERVGISTLLVAGFRDHAAANSTDLQAVVPADAEVGAVAVRLPRAGTHLLALDTHPNAIELPPDKFNAYLELEGLQGIIQARQQAGTSASPGRERYRRNTKTLLHAGGKSDSTFSSRTGQRLEIVPLVDPYRANPGTQMGFQVLFDARPLPGALVKFWNRSGPQLLALHQRTDAQGRLSIALPQPGVWMASLVHMIPATGSNEFDWDSYWGNLTFALRPQPP